MRTILGINNIVLILAMIGCCAGALAGLIVLLPFVAGAWALNLVGLLGFEETVRANRMDSSVAEAHSISGTTAGASPVPRSWPETELERTSPT